MNYLKSMIALFLISLFSVTAIFGQYKEEANQSGVGIPFFKLATHQQFEEDLEHTKLVVMTQFLYDDLTFIKQDTLFNFFESAQDIFQVQYPPCAGRGILQFRVRLRKQSRLVIVRGFLFLFSSSL